MDNGRKNKDKEIHETQQAHQDTKEKNTVITLYPPQQLKNP